ncbi:coiled-coil domain-containing protein 96-like [Ylistrum balloti]|uniref:coiled-coil domain-containing protein 96-like n=1 Tax=Ylistrum balloti TaxID=509963 RepID=UPI002905C1D8|nr:coiled-coil domain-containing protein 96-like [Ylistrum balloti]
MADQEEAAPVAETTDETTAGADESTTEPPAPEQEITEEQTVENTEGENQADTAEGGQTEDQPTEQLTEQQTEGEEAQETQDEQPPKEGEDGEQKTEGEEGTEVKEPKEGDEGADVKEGEEGAVAKESEETTETKGEEEGAEPKETEEGAEPKEGEDGAEPKEGEDGAEPKEGEEGGEKKDGEPESGSPVPQSDTFAAGERAESPIGVGEKLSREGSPTQEAAEVPQPDTGVLEPGTPERSRPASQTGEHDKHLETFQEEQEEEEEEEEEEEQEPEFDREALMEKYYATITEREKLQQQNYQLQHKLAELFRKKKADENRQDYDKNANDQDSKYVKYMAQLDELRKQDMLERDNFEVQIEEVKEKCEQKKEMVDEERKRFMEFKKHVALNSVSNRSGKPIPPKDIDQYLSNEMKKESEVVNVRLENIKLKNKLKKKEMQLKSKEELAENLHLIDFEQLKIENQTYNEKIEERNEELLKLRKKITSTVQVLTHLKEKLQFVQAENQVQKTTLREVESEAAMKRDILSRTKQARDALRIDNQRLRQNCGLLGNESLLRDFEERKDEGDDLRHRLESLKMEHAELTLNCNQVRRKIEQARASHG